MNVSKKILAGSFFLSLLGCDTDALKNNKSKMQYENRVEQELNSGVINDDIFLIFKFGDSENDVNAKFEQLKKEHGKITLDDKRRYTYEFVFDEYDFNNGYATFSPIYHNNMLYKFKMRVEPYDVMEDLGGSGSYELLQTSSESLLYNLAMIYMEKFGVPIEKSSILFNTKDFFWINGNREIKISLGSGFVNVIYTELSVLSRMEEQKKNKLRNEAEVTKKDI